MALVIGVAPKKNLHCGKSGLRGLDRRIYNNGYHRSQERRALDRKDAIARAARLSRRRVFPKIIESKPCFSDPFVKQNGFNLTFIGWPFAAEPRRL